MTEPALSFVGVWTALIALGVILYVLLDGFDLGAGMLHGFARDTADRELIMNTIAPIWDGNETWLVFCICGAGGDRSPSRAGLLYARGCEAAWANRLNDLA